MKGLPVPLLCRIGCLWKRFPLDPAFMMDGRNPDWVPTGCFKADLYRQSNLSRVRATLQASQKSRGPWALQGSPEHWQATGIVKNAIPD